MEINEYRVFADKCFRDTPPPCGAVCPLAYDMREFIKLMQRGSYRSAYRLYRNSVIFPAFVSELCPGNCEAACVRAQFPGDSAIGIKGLEKALVARMAGKKPERYQIPKKNQKIAVVGGGLAGLACAYRASSFGYSVDLYERSELLGGYAKNLADPQWCHDVLIGEFASVNADFHLKTEITDLASIDADAVFLATGAEEDLFNDADPRVFFSTLDPTENVSEAIARGLRAVTAIEEYLKIGKKSFDAAPVRNKADERYYSLDYDRGGKTPVPGKGEPEAYRCISCNCDACMKVCPMMEKDRIFPKRMCNEIILTLKPNMSKRTSVRMVMGCTDCGQCKDACPEHIDMGQCISQARIDFYESGAMSPAFHDFWLQDMEFSMSDEAAFLVKRHEEMDCDVLFFPGCQLGASEPEYVTKAYEAVSIVSENAGLYAGCCGVPALWAGQTEEAAKVADQFRSVWKSLGQPKVITACPTCLKSLRRTNPEMEIESLYKWLDRFEKIPGSGTMAFVNYGKKVRVLDPCASAEEAESQKSVRNLLKKAGFAVENEAADIGCCGFGGHIVTSVPELQKRFAKHRVEDKTGKLVTYCANCRDVFANEGAEAEHLLGVLFGMEDGKRIPPDLDERRENRRALKRMYVGEADMSEAADIAAGAVDQAAGATEVADDAQPVLPEILITREILDKMNHELVLREEVEQTIRQGEAEKSIILDEADQLFYVHKRFRTTTLWVVYSKTEQEILVTNVYLHRVAIREE